MRAGTRGTLVPLHADDALGRGRQHLLGYEQLADAIVELESLEPGSGQDDGVIVAVIELGQARVDVAAQPVDFEIGKSLAHLRLAAQARSADATAGRQIGKTVEMIGDKSVARILAFHHQRQFEPLGKLHRHVLQ